MVGVCYLTVSDIVALVLHVALTHVLSHINICCLAG